MLSLEGGKQMSDYDKIWESFVRGIDFDHQLIKKDILSSWIRCKEKSVSLYDFDENLLMNPKDRENYRLNNKEFCNIVATLNLDISVYDKNSKLQYIVNYNENFDLIYPEVGYFLDVSEEAIGTNSTCLALRENKPFLVVGTDHYKYIFHKFSCGAAPFYDEKGNLQGTINASFINVSVTEDTLNVIYSLARLYENIVLKQGKKSQSDLLKPSRGFLKNDMIGFEKMIGKSEKFLLAKAVALKSSRSDASVLIYGESGTGKEVFAESIHFESKRKNAPFIAINCGAIPADLIESELFGYESGAFTGASKQGKIGLLECASGGTLFLDEIESMPLIAQVKILRVLSEGLITPIGSTKTIPVDIRVIAASKKNLNDAVLRGNFREDLYYRINVVEIFIPPLRERKEDIELIFDHYLKTFSQKNSIEISKVEEDFLPLLKSYSWPGNIRELLNIIERAIVLSENGIINHALLPNEIKERAFALKLKNDFDKIFDGPLPESKNLLELAENIIIERIYSEEKGNLSKTAQRLGLSRPTLYKKIEKSGIKLK